MLGPVARRRAAGALSAMSDETGIADEYRGRFGTRRQRPSFSACFRLTAHRAPADTRTTGTDYGWPGANGSVRASPSQLSLAGGDGTGPIGVLSMLAREVGYVSAKQADEQTKATQLGVTVDNLPGCGVRDRANGALGKT